MIRFRNEHKLSVEIKFEATERPAKEYKVGPGTEISLYQHEHGKIFHPRHTDKPLKFFIGTNTQSIQVEKKKFGKGPHVEHQVQGTTITLRNFRFTFTKK